MIPLKWTYLKEKNWGFAEGDPSHLRPAIQVDGESRSPAKKLTSVCQVIFSVSRGMRWATKQYIKWKTPQVPPQHISLSIFCLTRRSNSTLMFPLRCRMWTRGQLAISFHPYHGLDVPKARPSIKPRAGGPRPVVLNTNTWQGLHVFDWKQVD